MYYDIVDIKHLGGYKIEIEFADGKKGIVDFNEYIQKGGVFERFKDIKYFRKVHIDSEWKTLCWPEGIDIAPETLYVKATGASLPGRMKRGKEALI